MSSERSKKELAMSRLQRAAEKVLACIPAWREAHYNRVKTEIECRYRGELYILESEGPQAFPLSPARRRELGL